MKSKSILLLAFFATVMNLTAIGQTKATHKVYFCSKTADTLLLDQFSTCDFIVESSDPTQKLVVAGFTISFIVNDKLIELTTSSSRLNGDMIQKLSSSKKKVTKVFFENIQFQNGEDKMRIDYKGGLKVFCKKNN